MSFISPIIAITLLIPFVGWGIYILRLQLVYREELETITKWISVAGVGLFFTVELSLLRLWLGSTSLDYMMTALALIVSTAALYGHLFVSITTQLIVDIIHPSHEHDTDTPDFSQADALEEVGDYDAALNEYFVMARIFPKDPEPLLRIAESLIHLNNYEDAAQFFEKGLAKIGIPDRAMRISNRLSGLYSKQLDKPDDAKRILNDFLERFPDSEHCTSTRARLDRMNDKKPDSGTQAFKSVTGMLEPPPSDLSG